MRQRLAPIACLGLLGVSFACASDPPGPAISGISVSNAQKRITWTPAPAVQTYGVQSSLSVTGQFVPAVGVISGNRFATTNFLARQFFRVSATPMASNALLTASVLNRIAYGPTPDELERVTAIGPQAYIDEQLSPELLSEPMDETPPATLRTTNSVPTGQMVKTNWINVRVGGTLTSSNLYVYLAEPGEAYIDDIAIYAGRGATMDPSTNFVRNGDFEAALTPPWTVSANHAASAIVSDVKNSGNSSLRLVASTGGTTQGSSIWQSMLTGGVLTNGAPITLSFWYQPRSNAGALRVRLSGNGVSVAATNEPPATTPTWIYATATGSPTRNAIYLYLDSPGVAYIDELKIVPGTVPEVGVNAVANGGFESPLSSDWTRAPNTTNSGLSGEFAFAGDSSLKLHFTAGGSSDTSALVLSNLPVALNTPYTISYWYLPSQRGAVTVRFSGSGIVSAPDAGPAAIYRRLDTLNESANLDDLRGWFSLHAVAGNRQLIETLSQFWENHFVTYHSKTADYLDRYYDDFDLINRIAAGLEFREMKAWREAMLNPNCTFYDLLRVSAESPAQIIYLDTVDSRGDGANIANENYARELLELYTMGVDNGYDQNDIVLMSRAWTGWTVRLVDPSREGDPFAPQSTTIRVLDGNTSISNLVGVWNFVFRESRHGTNRGNIFPGKTVPARFGAPWADRPYHLRIPGRVTGDTNGIQDGYEVIRHLADLPFTAEYISVKLCRLFVHDGFPNPTTHTDLPEYAFYDYTDPNRSAEAELVRQCLVAWDTPGPDGRKGNLRQVLRTIFDSDLFRSHGGSLQKVKTPFEFCASAIRALRSVNANGTATAVTDGYSFRTPMGRMGVMSLFNRADPDGYPESGPPWISAGTLAERLRFVQSLLLAGTGDDAGNSTCDPVALLKKKLPAGSWNNAAAVADYFVGILFPGEGRANLDAYRAMAVAFLNTDNDGVTSSPFVSQSNVGTTYDTRVRGMVSLLMTTQRFQEQ